MYSYKNIKNIIPGHIYKIFEKNTLGNFTRLTDWGHM